MTAAPDLTAPATRKGGRATALSVLLSLLLAAGCTTPAQSRDSSDLAALPQKGQEAVLESHVGLASWYGPGFHGRRTASGTPFDRAALTAAHPSLPFGSRVRVTNLANGRSVVVLINDRGPYVKPRIIDLSQGAAKALGFLDDGVTRVRLDLLADPAS